MQNDVITMAHGSGGAGSAELVRSVFTKRFSNETLDRLEDSAVVGNIAVSTDSFVVKPLVFPGGDIGKLAVCGTVNDVLMSGAEPRYLTCGFILETGLPIETLDAICASLAEAADEAGVTIIAGDTKVIEGHEEGGGLMINTTGIGFFKTKGDVPCVLKSHNKTKGDVPCVLKEPSPWFIRPGDAIIVSGNLGDHHAAILSSRMNIKNDIQSDCAILTPIISSLREEGIEIHAMRDVTRGGLATVLNELAEAAGVSIEIKEESIPVSPEVRAFCGIMGLDPLYMGNEGKMTLAVAPETADRALAAIKKTDIGKDAAIIGTATEPYPCHMTKEPSPCHMTKGRFLCHPVLMRTKIGGTVRLDVLYGEGLPRIC